MDRNFSCLFALLLSLTVSGGVFAADSHLGQDVDSHVNLTYSEDDSDICRTNFIPGEDPGLFSLKYVNTGEDFVVPPKRELVITDIHYVARRMGSASL